MDEAKKILGLVTIPLEITTDVKESITNVVSFGTKIQEYTSKNTTDLVNMILAGSIVLGASDIHIEPEEEKAKIRLRVDGLLQDVISLDHPVYNTMVSRIKLL